MDEKQNKIQQALYTAILEWQRKEEKGEGEPLTIRTGVEVVAKASGITMPAEINKLPLGLIELTVIAWSDLSSLIFKHLKFNHHLLPYVLHSLHHLSPQETELSALSLLYKQSKRYRSMSLTYAVECNRPVWIDTLVQYHQANLHDEDEQNTALETAAIGGHRESTQWMLESYVFLPAQQQKAFFFAVAHGHSQIAQLFLQHSPHLLNERDDKGYSPLMWATKCGYSNLVVVLLKYGADPTLSRQNFMGATETACSLAKTGTQAATTLQSQYESLHIALLLLCYETAWNSAPDNAIAIIRSYEQFYTPGDPAAPTLATPSNEAKAISPAPAVEVKQADVHRSDANDEKTPAENKQEPLSLPAFMRTNVLATEDKITERWSDCLYLLKTGTVVNAKEIPSDIRSLYETMLNQHKTRHPEKALSAKDICSLVTAHDSKYSPPEHTDTLEIIQTLRTWLLKYNSEHLALHIKETLKFHNPDNKKPFKNEREEYAYLAKPFLRQKKAELDRQLSQEKALRLLCESNQPLADHILNIALHYGFSNCVASLIEHGASMQLEWLDAAVARGNVQTVKIALEFYPEQKLSLLSRAIKNTNLENYHSHAEIIKAVLKASAELNGEDKQGLFNTARESYWYKTELLALIVPYYVPDLEHLKTLFFEAILHKNASLLTVLLRTKKVDLNWRSERGHTALTLATSEGAIEITKILILEGIDPTLTHTNENGIEETAQEYATFNALYNYSKHSRADHQKLMPLLAMYERAWRMDKSTAVSAARDYLALCKLHEQIENLWQDCIFLHEFSNKSDEDDYEIADEKSSNESSNKVLLKILKVNTQKNLTAIEIIKLLSSTLPGLAQTEDSQQSAHQAIEKIASLRYYLVTLRHSLFDLPATHDQYTNKIEKAKLLYRKDENQLEEFKRDPVVDEERNKADSEWSESRFIPIFMATRPANAYLQMLEAIKLGFHNYVARAIREGAEIGAEMLDTAATANEGEILAYLVKNRPDISISEIQQVFLTTISCSSLNAALALQDATGFDVNHRNEKESTCLLQVAQDANLKAVKLLILHFGVNPTLTYDGETVAAKIESIIRNDGTNPHQEKLVAIAKLLRAYELAWKENPATAAEAVKSLMARPEESKFHPVDEKASLSLSITIMNNTPTHAHPVFSRAWSNSSHSAPLITENPTPSNRGRSRSLP